MATFYYQSGIRLNHLSDYHSDRLVTVHSKIFKEFPIYTRDGDANRLEKIYDDIHNSGQNCPNWEQQQEIDQELGTTWINVCLN